MQPIPAETVDRAWQELARMEPTEGDQVMQGMILEQPDIVAYLVAVGEKENLNEDEREVLLYVGAVVWYILTQGGVSSRRATERVVLQVEKELAGTLGGVLDGPREGLIAAAERLAERSPQPEVLHYVIDAVLEEEDDPDAEIRDEERGTLFLALATEVEVLCRLAR